MFGGFFFNLYISSPSFFLVVAGQVAACCQRYQALRGRGGDRTEKVRPVAMGASPEHLCGAEPRGACGGGGAVGGSREEKAWSLEWSPCWSFLEQPLQEEGLVIPFHDGVAF